MAVKTNLNPVPPETATNQGGIVPTHLGIILDGNRRWAAENGIPKLEGHRHGYQTLKTICDAAIDRGIKYLTAYVFSTENWQRPPIEVRFLMDLLYWVATHEVEEFHKKGIRLVFLGKEAPLAPKILRAVYEAEQKTKGNTKGTLAMCLNYGGQTELAEAFAKMMATGVKADEITPELIEKYLYHPELPPVDFIIRTSGEQRLSNFMLWRAAYSELYFVKKHWPAFTTADLDLALAHYGERVRRFGQ